MILITRSKNKIIANMINAVKDSTTVVVIAVAPIITPNTKVNTAISITKIKSTQHFLSLRSLLQQVTFICGSISYTPYSREGYTTLYVITNK